MVRIILGIALLIGVGTGGYYLGTRREAPQTSALAPLEPLPVIANETLPTGERVETFDPVMFRMIENHFKVQADWKSGE